MQSWRKHTACAPDRWPGRDPATHVNEWYDTTPFARSVCARCPVRAECADQAINDGEHNYGLFGGLTYIQRRPLNELHQPGHRWSKDCTCPYCVLLGQAVNGRRINLNSPNARHGFRATYSRGCHCPACTLAMFLDARDRKSAQAEPIPEPELDTDDHEDPNVLQLFQPGCRHKAGRTCRGCQVETGKAA